MMGSNELVDYKLFDAELQAPRASVSSAGELKRDQELARKVLGGGG